MVIGYGLYLGQDLMSGRIDVFASNACRKPVRPDFSDLELTQHDTLGQVDEVQLGKPFDHCVLQVCEFDLDSDLFTSGYGLGIHEKREHPRRGRFEEPSKGFGNNLNPGVAGVIYLSYWDFARCLVRE